MSRASFRSLMRVVKRNQTPEAPLLYSNMLGVLGGELPLSNPLMFQRRPFIFNEQACIKIVDKN